MTKDDVTRMAREAGFRDADEKGIWITDGFWDDELGRFAALVAAAEREACAKLCASGIDTEHPTVKGHIMKNFGVSSHLAAAIRARGQE